MNMIKRCRVRRRWAIALSISSSLIILLVVVGYSIIQRPLQPAAVRFDCRQGRFSLWTATYYPHRWMLGSAYHVISLKDDISGRSIPVASCKDVFQEGSSRPVLTSVDSHEAIFTSSAGRIDITWPSTTIVPAEGKMSSSLRLGGMQGAEAGTGTENEGTREGIGPIK
jgi:hypothetical protein